MITPAYSPTATERILPRLALDFTTASLDSRVTVTRALNTATRVNSSGNIEVVNANLPRFDYDPITLACKGLLIEETRTNLMTYTESLDTLAQWGQNAITVNANAVTSPDGTANADTIVPNTTVASHTLSSTTPVTAGITYAVSIFAKSAGYRYVSFKGLGLGGTGGAIFDLQNGVVVSANAWSSASIQAFPNGWYRLSAVGTATGAAGPIYCVYDNATNTNFAGDGVSGVHMFGAQAEAGAFATSYIPNVSFTANARNADAVSMTGANFSSWYAASANSIAVSVTPITVSGVRPACQADDGTANEVITLRGNAADPELYIVDGGVVQAQIDVGAISANTTYTLCGAWALNNCAASKSGGTPGTDTSATVPSPNQLRIGSDGTNYLSGWVRTLRSWPQRITNAETQAFSS